MNPIPSTPVRPISTEQPGTRPSAACIGRITAASASARVFMARAATNFFELDPETTPGDMGEMRAFFDSVHFGWASPGIPGPGPDEFRIDDWSDEVMRSRFDISMAGTRCPSFLRAPLLEIRRSFVAGDHERCMAICGTLVGRLRSRLETPPQPSDADPFLSDPAFLTLEQRLAHGTDTSDNALDLVLRTMGMLWDGWVMAGVSLDSTSYPALFDPELDDGPHAPLSLRDPAFFTRDLRPSPPGS